MHTDAKSLKERGDRLFSQKRPLDLRNQEIADQFYPERADFTVSRDVGDEFASHMLTGYPAMVRRELGNSIGSMLRPKSKHWFHMTVEGLEDDHAAKEWLEAKTGVQRRAMADRVANFARATKEGDHDFSTFGGCCISTEVNRRDNALLYRSWHLRDMAWAEDAYGALAEYHRNWTQPTAAMLAMMFGENAMHDNVKQMLRDPKKKHEKVKCRHVTIEAEHYDATKRFRTPWVSLYIDCDNEHVIEERGSWTRVYTVPRWATVSGSQYPYSPAALIALPDARLVQAMTLTLLDAGERTVAPPMIGVTEAIRGDMNVYPGGFTAVDAEYDERLGEVLRPLAIDARGLTFGVDMLDRTAAQLREAFYLNALGLPPRGGPDMTAFEVGQRVQEYIRQATPLFEPMEPEYNGGLCEITFETLFREGAFGPVSDIPESLSNADVQFRFESPLTEAVERQKGQTFLEAQGMLAAAAQSDPSVMEIMDFGETLRDVLEGVGVPTKWTRSKDEVDAAREAQAQQQAMAQALAAAQQGAEAAKTFGEAREALQPTDVI